MDFVTFDGVWDDSEDTRQSTDDLPWHFIEFGFEDTGKPHSSTTSKIKSNKPKSKSRLFRVYDTERHTSTYPVQNITKTHDDRLVVKNNRRSELQQISKENRRKSKPVSQQKSKSTKFSWILRTPSSISTASTESLSPVFSEDDSFWDEIVSRSSSFDKVAKVPYSERSAITDGAKVQSRSFTDMKNRSLLPNKIHLRTSYWTEMNGRAYMEDRVIVDFIGPVPLSTHLLDMEVLVQKLEALKSESPHDAVLKVPAVRAKKGPDLPLSLYATFDGHAGPLASQYCSDWFSFYLRKQPSYPHDLPLALRTAFHNIDKDFMRSGNRDGTTACVCAVVGGRKVICANAGDSRAIIVKRDGRFISLSKDHKPGSPTETKRITDLGGRVIYAGRWRVEG